MTILISNYESDSSSSEGESPEGEIEDDETFEATTSNKENEPILDPKKSKEKLNGMQNINASWLLSNRPTYEIPNANKTNSFKSAVKDVECEICRKKFTKQGLNSHWNSC